jgi:FkbM family methyltransferase
MAALRACRSANRRPSEIGPMAPKVRWVRRAVRWIGRQHWIRFGIRDRVARFVHDPDEAVSEEFATPFFGLTYTGDFSSFIDWSVYYFGAYAAGELALFDRVLGVIKGGVCLDVGANVGHHTLFLATRAASVIAFEPLPELADQIRARVAQNALGNVEVVQCGLGDRAGELPFFASTDHNQGTGTFIEGVDDRTSQMLKVRPGDELLAERGDLEVVLVKIDVEGFEPDVLRGLRTTLGRERPVVFFEWSDMSERRAGEAQPDSFFPADYSLFRFYPEVVRWSLFTRAPFALRRWVRGSDAVGNLLAVPTERFEALQLVLQLPGP